MSASRPQCEREGCGRAAEVRATFARIDEEATVNAPEAGPLVREGRAQDLCREHFEREYRDHGGDWTVTVIPYSPEGTLAGDEPRPAEEFLRS